MAKVLLWSSDPVGRTMAGPGIRYYHFAKELSKRFDVTLATPNEPELAGEPFDVRHASRVDAASARAFDVVVAQRLPPVLARRLARSSTRVIYDLYVPWMVESLAYLAGQARPVEHRRLRLAETRLVQELALVTGNAFVCASERQCDLWLGALCALGRLCLVAYADEPTLRMLFDVVYSWCPER